MFHYYVNDILLFSQDVPKAIDEIKKAIRSNKISQQEIDKRCRKVLMAKKWMGLDKYKPVDLSIIHDHIITEETKKLDKKLVQSSLTLLQNYGDLLPLKRLDTLQIALLNIGEEPVSSYEIISQYAPVTKFAISENANISEQAILLNKLTKFNLVIVNVHKSNAHAWKSYKIPKETDVLLQSIALQSKVVVSVFANPYSINSFLSTDNFDAFIMSYQNSPVAKEQTAQAIFGGIGMNGKIPVTTKHFGINSGIQTFPTRMRYVDPLDIGFKSELLYKIDSIVEDAIFHKATPGCQILIAKDGNIFFNKSYGYHTYNKEKIVQNSDVYDIASITKIVATVPLLMKMIDDGYLDLDNSLGEYLDLESTNKEDLIIRDVLAHQARLKPWIPFYKRVLVEDTILPN